ncbi:MAG: UDP-N-acetylmuramoyl-L-alanine--D-glutamate ligase [bacterium]|nr:UDP-N-acetylmuramoyl-L-alanine--D-glutamate ligase [bacterium]
MEWSPQSKDWQGKRVTVMGLGLHGGGLAVARWFLARGALVTVTDRKTREALAPSVRELERTETRGTLRLVLGEHRVADFRNADLIVQNPGVPRESRYLAVAQRAGVPIENEASLFFRIAKRVPSPPQIIAVTGTRGKSTTSALLYQMLRASGRKCFLAGNIRKPMFDQLDAILRAAKRGPVTVILELSSWHCERLTRATGGPDIAVVTNIMRDHLNRYGSLRSYAAAKRRILVGEGMAVLNGNDARVRAMGLRTRRAVTWCMSYASRINNPALRGEHNRWNVGAAAAAARLAGVSAAAIARGIAAYDGLPGRLEPISRVGGITWINDTCATTPDATMAALEALGSKEQGTKNKEQQGIVLIAGGTDKELEFEAWAQAIVQSGAAMVFLPGTATDRMLAALRATHGVVPQVILARSMREAVRKARRMAVRGDTVLLSPGAASFGLFVHEFDRGDQFVRAVHSL